MNLISTGWSKLCSPDFTVHVVWVSSSVSACGELRPPEGAVTGQGYRYKKAWKDCAVGRDVDCEKCLEFIERWKSRSPGLAFFIPREPGESPYWWRRGGAA